MIRVGFMDFRRFAAKKSNNRFPPVTSFPPSHFMENVNTMPCYITFYYINFQTVCKTEKTLPFSRQRLLLNSQHSRQHTQRRGDADDDNGMYLLKGQHRHHSEKCGGEE